MVKGQEAKVGGVALSWTRPDPVYIRTPPTEQRADRPASSSLRALPGSQSGLSGQVCGFFLCSPLLPQRRLNEYSLPVCVHIHVHALIILNMYLARKPSTFTLPIFSGG